jgi:hypothetical protein
MLKLDLEREELVVNYEVDERRLSVTRALMLEILRRLRLWSINYGRMDVGRSLLFDGTLRQGKPSLLAKLLGTGGSRPCEETSMHLVR